MAQHVPRVQRPPVHCCGDDTGRHVGAGRGRRPAISCRISATSGSGIATSATLKVTYLPWRTTLIPRLTNHSRSMVSDHSMSAIG